MKPFKTINEQVQILKSRNLGFVDEEFARTILKNYSYYDIVNGYKDILLDKEKSSINNDVFRDGEVFEHLYNLYLLDRRIQSILRDAMLDFELILKNAMSYVISKNFGIDENIYLDRNKYDSGNKKFNNKTKTYVYEIDELIDIFNKISNDNIQPFTHYKKEHGHIPPWILFKGASLGNMKVFFKLQKSNIKNEIIKFILDCNDEELIIKKDIFVDTLALCNLFRNRASHSGRVFNYKAEKHKIRFNDIFHKNIKISEKLYRKGLGRNDLFTLMNALKYLEIVKPYNIISNQIYYFLNEFIKVYNKDKLFLLSSMGFPDEVINKNLSEILNQDIKESIFQN